MLMASTFINMEF